MSRPPRNLKKDRLLSVGLFMYAYVLMGLTACTAIVISYILVFNYHDLQLTDISFTTEENQWTFLEPVPFAKGSRIYSREEQYTILKQVNAAVFFNIVVCQFFHVWVVRTRLESVFARNPFRNETMNFGVILEVRSCCCCCICCCYGIERWPHTDNTRIRIATRIVWPSWFHGPLILLLNVCALCIALLLCSWR